MHSDRSCSSTRLRRAVQQREGELQTRCLDNRDIPHAVRRPGCLAEWGKDICETCQHQAFKAWPAEAKKVALVTPRVAWQKQKKTENSWMMETPPFSISDPGSGYATWSSRDRATMQSLTLLWLLMFLWNICWGRRPFGHYKVVLCMIYHFDPIVTYCRWSDKYHFRLQIRDWRLECSSMTSHGMSKRWLARPPFADISFSMWRDKAQTQVYHLLYHCLRHLPLDLGQMYEYSPGISTVSEKTQVAMMLTNPGWQIVPCCHSQYIHAWAVPKAQTLYLNGATW